MDRNTINVFYIWGHVIWYLEVVPVVYASDVAPLKNMSELSWHQLGQYRVYMGNLHQHYYVNHLCKKAALNCVVDSENYLYPSMSIA